MSSEPESVSPVGKETKKVSHHKIDLDESAKQ